MQNSNDLHRTMSDWRGTLAKNQRRTYFIIGLFILIYVVLGFILDVYIHGGFVEGNFINVFNAFMSFQIIPYATLTMGGVAIISILITYSAHDRLMLMGTDYHEITADNSDLEERQLYNILEEMKISAGLRYMPKLYIIKADYINAFASGYSEKSAMIAVTQGLMRKLNRSELQAVMAHELSHIRHGDIKLTLTASVLCNLMLIIVDLFFYNVIFGRNSRRSDNRLLIFVILLRYLLPIVTVLLLLFLSRSREYMADAGCVELMRDNYPLANALIKISNDHRDHAQAYQKAYSRTRNEEVRQSAYIFDPASAGIHSLKSIASIFSTHPTIEERLKAIGFKTSG